MLMKLNLSSNNIIYHYLLDIHYTKVTLDAIYKRDKIREFIALQEKTDTICTKLNGSNSYTSAYQSINLEETETVANLELEKNTLSVTETNQNLQMKLTLNTDNETKDLYKNPNIKITFPEQITKISAKCKLLYGNGLEIKSAKVGKENGKQVMILNLKGEQKKYPEDAVTGTTLLVYADVGIDKMSTSGNRQIVVNYSNENATKYSNGGKQVADIQITNEKEMILTNSIKDFNVQTIGDEDTKEVKLPIKAGAKKTSVDMEIINNEEKDITNVNILGKIPQVKGKIERVSSIKLNADATVYYTDVEKPTIDLNAKVNNWTTNNIKNAKNYLIVVNKMKKDEKVKVSYDVTFQKNLGYNLMTNVGYKVNYDTESHSEEVNATMLKLGTGVMTELSQTLTAVVGNDNLKDGDEVKAGEIIKYNVNIKNAGKEDANDVKLSAKVPDGMTLIEVNESGYFLDKSAEESTDRTQKTTNNENMTENSSEEDDSLIYFKENTSREIDLNNIKIPAESEVNYTFMVQVNYDIKNDVNTIFDIAMQYKDETKNQKISHKLVPSNFSVITVPMARLEKTELNPEHIYSYSIKLKNLSNEEQKNVKVNLNKNDLMDFRFISYESELKGQSSSESSLVIVPIESTTIEIPSIEAKDTINICIEAFIKSPTDVLKKTSMYAIVQESTGNTCRSNVISENIKDLSIVAKITAQTSSNAENNYINLSDTIKYKIDVKNVGKNDLTNLFIKDILSPYLEITNVGVNGANIKYETSYESTDETSDTKTQILKVDHPLEVGKSVEIEITAKLEEDMDITETLKISNKAEIYNNVYLKSTDEIVYYVKPNLSLDDPNNKDSDESTTPDTPNAPNEPDSPSVPDRPSNSDDPSTPNNPYTPSTPSKPIEKTYSVSGMAWLDEDGNGSKGSNEKSLNNIKVYAINTSTNVTTESMINNDGHYEITGLKEGKYLVAFEYDIEKYMLTKYQAEGVSENKNSNVIKSDLKINGEEKTLAVSDSINLTSDVFNINMGLVKAKKFDLELEKVISKVTVTNKEGTKTYDEKDTNLAKIEIAGKYLNGSNIIIEYKIKVKNTGEVAGYVKNIVDYIPSSLNFSGTSNKGWYESDGNIYNKSLSKTKLEPGETKELKLVLTKTMTESNTGLINNRAEIESAYNSLGIEDIDSKPGNQDKSEDDLGSADLIIGIKTGVAISYVIITLITILVIFGIAFVINKNILKEE